MKEKLLITTPIYYPSGVPHIGHAYTTVVADIIARYRRQYGQEVFFLTGTDEHGQKIEKKAVEAGVSPQEFVEPLVNNFIKLWKNLDIKYDHFIRTTDDYHKKFVKSVFSSLIKKDLIYLDHWNGLYCVSCEENYVAPANYLSNQPRCNLGHVLEKRSEESYFFKISKFQKWLEQYFFDHPEFIVPSSVTKELSGNFLNKNKLADLSVSRTNTKWGISIKENSNHAIYVWLDALSNYVSGTQECFERGKTKVSWHDQNVEIVHLVGKEITRFHAIYWPIILHSLNLRLPDHLLVNGWITSKQLKISKSLNNSFDIETMISDYGSDAIRAFLASRSEWGKDFEYSEELFISFYNTYLVNTYGNLINRFIGMVNKYVNKRITIDNKISIISDVVTKIIKTKEEIRESIINFKVYEVFNKSMEFANYLNKFIDDSKPWELAKSEDKTAITNFLFSILISVLNLIKLTAPVLTKSASLYLDMLGIKEESIFEKSGIYHIKESIVEVTAPTIIFPRRELLPQAETREDLI